MGAPRNGAPLSSSSKLISSVVAAAAPAHQLPPVVHAIGAAIGSALAILTFYPLERVRIELQSQGEGGKSNIISRETDECTRGSNDNNQNIKIKHKNENRAEDVVITSVAEHSQVEVKSEESSFTPNSSAGSFDLVSSIRSVDVVSLDTLSFDDDPADPNVLDSTEDDDNEEIASGSQSTSGPRDSNINEGNNVMLGADTNQNRDSKTLGPKIESDDRKPPPSHETIIQCLLRLHAEQSLYKGASHIVTTLMISNAVFFYALQVTRRSLASLQQHDRQRIGKKDRHPLEYFLNHILPKSKMGNSLIASSLAGAINVLLTNPLWVASLRIMESKKPAEDNRLQQQQSLWSVMHQIARNEGISRLWNGTRTSLLLVSNPIIQHFIYEQLRLWVLDSRKNRAGVRGNSSRVKHRHGREGNAPSLKAASLSPVEALVFGALAKAVATLVTYPLQLAQVLLRLQKKKRLSSSTNSSQHDTSNTNAGNENAYEGTLDCLYQQFSRGGVTALFKGMNAKLLQTVMTAAFTFLTYEQTLVQVARIYETLGSKR